MYSCDIPKSKRKTPLTVVLQSYNNKAELDYLIDLLHNRAKAKVVILEKGSLKKSDFPKTVTFHRLGNKGRELGAFLWYVVKYYSQLKGSYIFASANIGKHDRIGIICDLLKTRKKFQCNDWGDEVEYGAEYAEYDFQVDEYLGQQLLPAVVRPFGAWYTKYVGRWETYISKHPVCFNGVFKTHASYLRKRDPKFYKRISKQVHAHNAPEVGHYLERAVSPVFGPN